MITITGLVYAIVLAPDANPVGLGVYTNIGYHYISPWATVLIPAVQAAPTVPGQDGLRDAGNPRGVADLHVAARPTARHSPPEAPSTQLGEPQNWYPYRSSMSTIRHR